MTGSDATSAVPPADRVEWLRNLRRVSRQQEDALAPVYDANWGEIEPLHRKFVERFLSKLPPDGRVLDAACGTGKYFGMVLDSGCVLVGVDQAAASLAIAEEKFPAADTANHYLQELPYEDEFDGVMCVDAMEFVPPEDWPQVLDHCRRALHARGWLYVTVELVPSDQIRALNHEGRKAGLPLVAGEVIWHEPDGPLYHHYPGIERVRDWMAAAGFTIEEDVEGPWDKEDDYAYHHLLARH